MLQQNDAGIYPLRSLGTVPGSVEGGQLIPYPTGVLRFALRLPLLLYRLGLGSAANAARIMVLTTRGRKSGLARHTAIEYRGHGSKFYVVSVWGKRPDWVQNLLAEERVTIQQGTRVYAARASLVDNPGEALRVLHLFRRVNPPVYDELMARMSDARARDVKTLPEITGHFTIVRLDRQPDEPTLAPLRADLTWMVPLGLGAVATALVFAAWSRLRRED